ncbi:MAG TPA: serine hydrolase [Stellaceae bacterium]|nr:serine hydrolase [Stellaceae bacterium]
MGLGRRIAATLLLAALWLPAATPAGADTIWPTKAWETSTPEEQGLDSAALARLVEAVGRYRQDSLLIVRHGRIVLDVSYAPYEPGITHDLRSITKSVTGTLTAIELRDGLLDSVDHPVVDLFADKHIDNLDDRKRAITVQTMLDMTSGIAWKEKAYTPDESIMQMYRSADRAEFVLSQPMAHTPGTQFYYNSGNPYVLSALITRKTGETALAYAQHVLFAPLGITSAKWGKPDAQGVSDGEAGLFLAPHDMARLGYLYLHDGEWDGQQIIPASWVARARQGPVTAFDGFHYGNLWWSRPEQGAFMALGRHSQVILVIPRLDVVAVMTGYLEDNVYYPMDSLIADIAGAVRSDGPAAADAVARSLLQAAIRHAGAPPPAPVGAVPAMAQAISGRVYAIEDNLLRVKTLSLDLVGPDPSWEAMAFTRKSDASPTRYGGALGLDGVFRRSILPAGEIQVARGRWLSERRFLLERRILGHGETDSLTFTFEGNRVEAVYENTDGFKAELHGEAKD